MTIAAAALARARMVNTFMFCNHVYFWGAVVNRWLGVKKTSDVRICFWVTDSELGKNRVFVPVQLLPAAATPLYMLSPRSVRRGSSRGKVSPVGNTRSSISGPHNQPHLPPCLYPLSGRCKCLPRAGIPRTEPAEFVILRATGPIPATALDMMELQRRGSERWPARTTNRQSFSCRGKARWPIWSSTKKYSSTTFHKLSPCKARPTQEREAKEELWYSYVSSI
ncbi:hypothetical protein MAPG_08548 [Magnaporthiopsis poae ATCC 64411]|uniref:Uncharacterized protein n=1 Tax=Magnaporthiopsis poae (strain ATCC 64411 / 73-15) TaxID=644358 RepID=A0A0C4E7N2_MAGP6|nr:hypothetical protein MAPG_08548 [Magnaporthiopsis poae ATCC 64411]